MPSVTEELLESIVKQYIQTARSSLPHSIPIFVPSASSPLSTPDQQAAHLSKHQSLNLPTLFPSSCTHWPALKKWSPQYFKDLMGDELVTCAVTPNGLADAIVDGHFVQPCQEKKSVRQVIDWLSRHNPSNQTMTTPAHGNDTVEKEMGEDEVWYLQLQNGSLDLEFSPLKSDILDLPFSQCLSPSASSSSVSPSSSSSSSSGDPPLANIWIGNHLSKTSLHHDPFENLYCQIKGQKHITLYPPSEWYHLNEVTVPMAEYQRQSSDDNSGLSLVPDSNGQTIQWLDPPGEEEEDGGGKAKGFTVTLREGDCLYLPALWYHALTQTPNHQGMCISVNYWYEMDYFGNVWREFKAMRKVGLLALGHSDIAKRELEEEEDGL